MRFAVKEGKGWLLRQPGREETRLDDGRPVRPGEKGWTVNLAAACGFTAVTEEDRPATDPKTDHRWVRTLVDRDGTPWLVWTEQELTQAEKDARTAAAARQAKEDGLRNNPLDENTILVNAVTVRATNRAVNALIELVYGPPEERTQRGRP